MKGRVLAVTLLVPAVLMVAGCGSPLPSSPVTPPPGQSSSTAVPTTGPFAAALGPVETASPPQLPGYGVVGGSHAMPYPVACATSSAVPPRATATVTVKAGTAGGTIDLRVGDTFVVTALESCVFSWRLDGPGATTTAGVLTVIGGSLLPAGAQGEAWIEYRAVATGKVRLAAGGACAIPDPYPSQPAGVTLACDDVAHVFLVNVNVSS